MTDTTIPMTAISMLSDYPIAFYAIDNSGTSYNNPGIWDGFSRDEKWMMISNGISKMETGPTDASMVIGAGPVHLAKGDTASFTFSIFAGGNLASLRRTNDAARSKAKELGLSSGKYLPMPRKDTLYYIYPNPVHSNTISFKIGIETSSYVNIDISDYLGRIVTVVAGNRYLSAGIHSFENIDLGNISQGTYILRIRNNRGIIVEGFEVSR